MSELLTQQDEQYEADLLKFREFSEQLSDSEREKHLVETISGWVGADEIYEVFAQSSEMTVAVKEYISSPESGYPMYELADNVLQAVKNRTKATYLIKVMAEAFYPPEERDDNSFFRTLSLKLEEMEVNTEYIKTSVEHREAVVEGNGDLITSTRDKLIDLGEILYGEVDRDDFNNVAAYLREAIEKADVFDLEDGENIKSDLLAMLPTQEETGPYKELIINDEFLASFREGLNDFMGEYLEVIEEFELENGVTFSPGERASAYNKMLQMLRTNGFEHDFVATVKEDATSESVDQFKCEIKVAESRSNGEPTREEFISLAAHEVMTHVYSRIIGENSSAPLTGVGLPGFIITQEAQGKLAELINKDEYIESGVEYMLIAGLAKGYGGNTINAEDALDILWRRYYLTSMPGDSEKAKSVIGDREAAAVFAEKAKVRRMFRSTTGQVPGAVFLKDKSYRSRKLIERYQAVFEEHGANALKELMKNDWSLKRDLFNESQQEYADLGKKPKAA